MAERLVIEIDKKRRDAFKKKAAERGQTMGFLLRRFIDAFLKERRP